MRLEDGKVVIRPITTKARFIEELRGCVESSRCRCNRGFSSKHLFGLANGRAKLETRWRGMTMVAGSDSHYIETVGLGVTEIEAEDMDSVALPRSRI